MTYYISHHGIEGQKWGVQNGPPYPLDYNEHSKAERVHMEKERSSKPTKRDLTEYRKRMISEAPTAKESPRGANKGWWKNAPQDVVRRHYMEDQKRSVKESKRAEKEAKRAEKEARKAKKKKEDSYDIVKKFAEYNMKQFAYGAGSIAVANALNKGMEGRGGVSAMNVAQAGHYAKWYYDHYFK